MWLLPIWILYIAYYVVESFNLVPYGRVSDG
jgi:hypothetical protein